MSTGGIRDAIDSYLNSSQSGLIDIAWEGMVYYPNQSTPYLAPRMAALTRRAAGFGADAVIQWQGNYQISVWYPVGHGIDPLLSQVDILLALFKRGTTVITADASPITVSFETPSPTPAIQDNNWLQMPMLIPWFAYE